VTRVTAPNRLHFGLLSLPAAGRDRWPGLDGNPGQPVRHFGGVGLMVDRPGLIVRVEPANEWSATGPLADRALGFARQVVDSISPGERRPFRVVVEAAPAEHTGLGVGTQLGLAVAKGVAVELGHDWPATELATRVGRGERSAIGVHGFAAGGLIVEGGKRPGEAVSPLVGRYAFPEDWAVVLVTPPSPADWHGGRERQAFARLSELGPGPAETDALCRLVLTGILPALVSAELDAFGEAVYEFNARVGGVFARAQGGRYASPVVADVVARLRARGVRGVGQSSWGPTIFVVARRPEAEALAQELAPAVVTGASGGARVER
jgi:beta-ribofuranosylaminobenzene 5'-phosphate synthase